MGFCLDGLTEGGELTVTVERIGHVGDERGGKGDVEGCDWWGSGTSVTGSGFQCAVSVGVDLVCDYLVWLVHELTINTTFMSLHYR